MSLLNHFTRYFKKTQHDSDNGNEPLTLFVEGRVQELTLHAILNKVLSARLRLTNYISGSQEALSCEEMGDHIGCELGVWLHSEGKEKYGDLARFPELEVAHKKYHECAAEIVRLHDSGNDHEARRLLVGNFSRAAHDMQEIMAYLYKQAKK
ncbi:MAG: hypothetical protein CR974_00585 [Gammaproteobacteria bacterium]|nr:MAG: hypothetical protein CR974_00585 [Gammaproteobacteria bacterium]